MLYGDVEVIMAELYDVVFDSCVSFFGGLADNDLDRLKVMVDNALASVEWPVKTGKIRKGKISSYPKLAKEVSEALAEQHVVKQARRLKVLRTKLEKSFWSYNYAFLEKAKEELAASKKK